MLNNAPVWTTYHRTWDNLVHCAVWNRPPSVDVVDTVSTVCRRLVQHTIGPALKAPDGDSPERGHSSASPRPLTCLICCTKAP